MAGPLSVEDILSKQKSEREAAAKPKFLTKEARAKLALEKRNAEVKEQQVREDVDKQRHIELEQAAEEERRKGEASRYGQGGYGQGQNGYGQGQNGYGQGQGGYGQGQYIRSYVGGMADVHPGRYGRDDRYARQGAKGQDGRNGLPYSNGNGNGNGNATPPSGPRGHAPPSGPRGLQNGHAPAVPSPLASSSTPSAAAPSSPKPGALGDVAPPTDKELAVIRARYLGQKIDGKKPRLRKMADKKIVFDWSAGDDTTEQGTWDGELKAKGPGGAMLGGRLAGFDEKNAQAEIPVVGGTATQYADALERRRAGRGNNDERHWSDKPLDEMKDRDWRIFREDYSIAARGGTIPFPLRNWRESEIPSEILDVVDEIGYTEPSPIQRQAIPIGMQDRDLIGIAKTGLSSP